MEDISARKVHFAPFARQARAIQELLDAGEARDVTDLMRRALDYYLEARGRPALSEQARQMADEWHGRHRAEPPDELQDRSRATDEAW